MHNSNSCVCEGKPDIKYVYDAVTGEFTEPLTAVCTRTTAMNEAACDTHLNPVSN